MAMHRHDWVLMPAANTFGLCWWPLFLRFQPCQIQSTMGHQDQPWLTLLTCKNYDVLTDTYRQRVAVGAVLIAVR